MATIRPSTAAVIGMSSVVRMLDEFKNTPPKLKRGKRRNKRGKLRPRTTRNTAAAKAAPIPPPPPLPLPISPAPESSPPARTPPQQSTSPTLPSSSRGGAPDVAVRTTPSRPTEVVALFQRRLEEERDVGDSLQHERAVLLRELGYGGAAEGGCESGGVDMATLEMSGRRGPSNKSSGGRRRGGGQSRGNRSADIVGSGEKREANAAARATTPLTFRRHRGAGTAAMCTLPWRDRAIMDPAHRSRLPGRASTAPANAARVRGHRGRGGGGIAGAAEVHVGAVAMSPMTMPMAAKKAKAKEKQKKKTTTKMMKKKRIVTESSAPLGSPWASPKYPAERNTHRDFPQGITGQRGVRHTSSTGDISRVASRVGGSSHGGHEHTLHTLHEDDPTTGITPSNNWNLFATARVGWSNKNVTYSSLSPLRFTALVDEDIIVVGGGGQRGGLASRGTLRPSSRAGGETLGSIPYWGEDEDSSFFATLVQEKRKGSGGGGDGGGRERERGELHEGWGGWERRDRGEGQGPGRGTPRSPTSAFLARGDIIPPSVFPAVASPSSEFASPAHFSYRLPLSQPPAYDAERRMLKSAPSMHTSLYHEREGDLLPGGMGLRPFSRE